jgi:hypothetical protein
MLFNTLYFICHPSDSTVSEMLGSKLDVTKGCLLMATTSIGNSQLVSQYTGNKFITGLADIGEEVSRVITQQ